MLLQISLLLLPVAATAGWFMGNRDQKKRHKPRSGVALRHDYFRGLNYLINEQPDKAVDVFVRLLEVDSETVETHLALGNLFRRRGEVDRAIRIHQNLIARPQLDKLHRAQALSALGQDYLRAGVLDRAERLFLELVEMGEENQASLRFLLRIYQQEKDWSNAIKTAQKLQPISKEKIHVAIAHYYCELAEDFSNKGQFPEAMQQLKRALQADTQCARAHIIRADLELLRGNHKEAIRQYKHVIEQDPDYCFEVVAPLTRCYSELGDSEKCSAYLKQCLDKHPRFPLVLAIADTLREKEGVRQAIDFVSHEIQRQPSMRGLEYLLRLYLKNSSGETREKLTILQNFIEKLLADKPVYQCSHCGFSAKGLFWLCPSCHYWATVKPIRGLEGG